MADVDMSGEAPVLSDEEMGGPAREGEDLKADIEFETEPAPAVDPTSTAFESKIDPSLFNSTETAMGSATAPFEAVPLEESAVSSMEADLEPVAAPVPPTMSEQDALSAAPGLSAALDEPVGGSSSSGPVPPPQPDVLPSAVPGDADALVEHTQDPQPEPQQAEDAADFTQEQLDAEAFEPAPLASATPQVVDSGSATPKQAEAHAEAERIAEDQVAVAEVEAQAEDPADPTEQTLLQEGHLDVTQAEAGTEEVAQDAEPSHEPEQHDGEVSSEEDHESLLSGGLDPDSTQPSALVELLSSVDMPAFLAPYLDPPQDAQAHAGEDPENELELDAIRAPPVLLSYNGQKHWLFSRLQEEHDPAASTSAAGEGQGEEDQGQAAVKTDSSTHPLLFDDDHGLYYETLDKLFDHLHDYFPAFHDEQMEIRLCVQELGMEIPEDNVYARSMTLHDLDRVFIGCDLPGRLTLTLTEAPRFIYRFNQLARHVAKFSSAQPEEHEHYEGEEEIELPEEAEGAVDEDVEDAEGEIDEAALGPEVGKFDDAETDADADASGEPEPLAPTEETVQQEEAEPQEQEEAAAPTEAGHVEESALAEAGVDVNDLLPGNTKGANDEQIASNEATTPTVVGDETNGANGDQALSTDASVNGLSGSAVAPADGDAEQTGSMPVGDKSASVVSPKRSRDDDEADTPAESTEPNHESKRARAS